MDVQLTTIQVILLTMLVGVIATALGASYQVFVNRGKTQFDDDRIQLLWKRADAMEKRVVEQGKEIDALREEKLVDRAQIVALKLEVDELYYGVKQLTNQLEAAGLTPVWHVNRRSPSDRMAAHVVLAERITDKFSLEEMASLAFDVGIEIENVPGETRGGRARQLVNVARRNSKMRDLERRVDKLRPPPEVGEH